MAEANARRTEVNEAIKDNDSEGGRIPRKQIKADGTHKARIWPAHPAPEGEVATALEAKVVYLVPGYVPKRDGEGRWVKDAQGDVIKELRVKAVFDARVHGKAPIDLVDTYVSLVNRQAEQKYPNDAERQKQHVLPVKGNKLQGGNYAGINPIKTFLFYGEEITKVGGVEKREFSLYEVGKAIEKGIYKTAASENENDPLGTDACFTDPMEGRLARVIVDSVAGRKDAANWYTVSLVTEQEKVMHDGRPVSVMKTWPIPEEQLEWYDKEVEPLRAFRTKYNNRDLNTALDGLRLFDAEHGYGIVESDEFIEAYEALLRLFPEPVKEEGATNEGEGAGSSTSSKGTTDEFTLMDANELKAFIAEHKLPIVIIPKYTEDDLRDIIREVLSQDVSQPEPEPEVKTKVASVKTQPAPIVEEEPLAEVEPVRYEEEEEFNTAEEPAPVATPAAVGGSWKDRINKLKEQQSE